MLKDGVATNFGADDSYATRQLELFALKNQKENEPDKVGAPSTSAMHFKVVWIAGREKNPRK
jgi:hypothetical protein